MGTALTETSLHWLQSNILAFLQGRKFFSRSCLTSACLSLHTAMPQHSSGFGSEGSCSSEKKNQNTGTILRVTVTQALFWTDTYLPSNLRRHMEHAHHGGQKKQNKTLFGWAQGEHSMKTISVSPFNFWRVLSRLEDHLPSAPLQLHRKRLIKSYQDGSSPLFKSKWRS